MTRDLATLLAANPALAARNRHLLPDAPMAVRLVPRPSEVPAVVATQLLEKGPNKYGNRKTSGPNFMGGARIYRSAWEAEVARQLRDEMSAGQIRSVHPEVSLITGQTEDGRDVRCRVDFLVIDAHGLPLIVEAKGVDLPAGRAKRAVLKAQGWTVQVRYRQRKVRRA